MLCYFMIGISAAAGVPQLLRGRLVCRGPALRVLQCILLLSSPQLVCPNYYGDGSFAGDRLYAYEFFLVNLSQMWAMYNLVRVIYNNVL